MSARLHRLAEERSLAIHARIAERIRRDPEALRAAQRRVHQWRGTGSVARPYVDAWDRLLNGPLEELLNALVDPGEQATALRQVSPFAGIVSARERWAIWRAVRAASGL